MNTNLTKLTTAIDKLLDPTRPQPLARQALRPILAPRAALGLFLGFGTDAGMVIAGPEHHALVLGPPRSGKTTCLIIPAVALHPGPAVATSTKADVLSATIRHRTPYGQAWYWDPSNTTQIPAGVQPLRWSPLIGCQTWDQAVARTHALATAARPAQTNIDTHWVERAQALLAPLLHAAALSKADLGVVLSWLHRRELREPTTLLADQGALRGADLLVGVAATDGRELSGIFSTADSILAAYRTDAALDAARTPNFDPAAFVTSRDTIYLAAPASTQNLHAPLVVALLDQIRTATYARRPYPPVLFALDEVAQIAPLPDLPATIAEGGSQGLIVMACLQDLSQARNRWGPAADGFLTLFTHKIVLPGIADTTTLKAISGLAGDIDHPVKSTSIDSHYKTSTTWTTQRRPRLPIDAIAAGQPGTALLIQGTTLSRVFLMPVPVPIARRATR